MSLNSVSKSSEIELRKDLDSSRKRAHDSNSNPSGSDFGGPRKRHRSSNYHEFSDPDNRLVVTYENGTPIQDTLLSIQLMELDVQNHFQHQFRDTKRVLKALGSSASNLFWRHWMESTEKDLHMHTKTAMLKLIESWTFDMPSLSSSYSSSNVSPQFTKLAKILQSFEPHGADFRGIIVVERRSVAVMMAELLCYVDETSDFIRAVAVTSSKTLDSNSGKKLLGQFISGELNLLIVTEHVKVLHVGRPSVLIWYDLVDDPPRFCYQSQPGERRYYVIHLAETANEKHRIRLSLQDNVPLKDEDFDILFGKCREESNGSSTSSEDTDDDETTFIQDPITGKRLGPRDAKKALIRFLQEYHDDKNHRPIITLSEDSTGRYLCRVDLPSSLELGVISVWGTPQPSATQAEREACFIACQALYERGLLDYEFFPPTHDSFQDDYIKEGGNLSAIAASGMRRYERAVPLCWSTTVSATTNKLYPLLVTLASWLSPVLILTRFPLPEIPCFSVFSSADYHYSVRCLRCAPVVINEEQLGLLHRYTLRLARALTNRELVFSTHELLYFFSPVCNTSVKMEELPENKWSRPDISSRIDWNAIKLAAEQLFTPLVQEGSNLDEALIDAVIQDRWVEFTNRYNLVGIRSDLTPLSKNPESPDEPSFMEFCKTRRKNFDGLKDESQPMIEASIIPPLVDLLNPIPKPYRTGQKSRTRFLIPELCCKSTISAGNFRTAQFLPSITHRLSDILLAKQLNDNFFENRISQHHLFEALFPPSAETESSYERLELLGDAYLKYVVSAYLFATLPEKNEDTLHTARRDIVCNKALYSGAVSIGLPAFMRIKPFLPKVWQPALPPLVKTFCAPTEGNDTKIAGPGEGSSKPKRGKRQKQRDEQGVQWIGDKTVADVVEAIIGAAYLSKDRDLALWVSKRLKVSLPKVNQWSDLRSMYVVPTGLPAIEVSPKTISGVEKIVRFKFQKTDVLAEALTHGSKQQTLGYDRLEFLGDAILDFYVVKHVFERYPHLSSGGLSMLKSAMVINTSLAAFCVISGLDQYVQYTSTDMQQSFKAYSDKIKALHLQELQLAKEEGRQPGQFWLEIPAPKVLSDVVESVLGALFVSEGFSETGTDAFFYGALQPFLDEYVRMQTLSHHPSIGLYEWFQGEGCQEHQIVKSSEGNQTECKVIVHDVILASAMDPAPTTARRLAASYALDALEGDPLFMSRVCDCRANRASKKLQKKVLGYEDDEDDAVS